MLKKKQQNYGSLTGIDPKRTAQLADIAPLLWNSRVCLYNGLTHDLTVL